MSLFTSLAGAAALPGGVTIESAILPPITLLQPGAGDGNSGSPDGNAPSVPLWLALVRPRVTAQTLAGAITIAPGGDPPDVPWLGFVLGAGFLVMAGLACYGALRLVRG